MTEDSTVRKSNILTIDVVESLDPTEEGLELNEGYSFEISGSIPQLADGLAKLAVEMDKDMSLGNNVGGAFIALIEQYYKKLAFGGEVNASV